MSIVLVALDQSDFNSVLLTVIFHLRETGKPALNKCKLNFEMLKTTQMRFSLNKDNIFGLNFLTQKYYRLIREFLVEYNSKK